MRNAINPRTLVADIVHEELIGISIVIAEIGARVLDPDSHAGAAEIFHNLPAAKVLAFEADPEACEQFNILSSHFPADIKAYPYALSDKPGQQPLYVTRNKMCSSLYKPNEKMLERYADLEVAYLEKTCPIEVTSLDRFMQQENISNIDFIKIDVQGAELDIFKGASRAMPQLLGLCTEVEFVELYQGQPLFGEIDAMLRKYDLQFYNFRDTGNSPVRGTAIHGKTQLLWADAIYFPSLELIDQMPAEQLLKLSVLSSLYEAYDLSQYALKRFDEISGTHYVDDFVGKLTAIAQGANTDGKDISADEKAEQIADTPNAQQPRQTATRTKTVRIKHDILVTVPDNLNLMTPYILEEQQDWFEDEIKFVRHLIKPGMQIIDIGANYGCYALTMAKLAGPEGRIWAFEPCSSTADHLQQSIAANGLDQVQLIRAALSNRQGEATLSTQDNAELNSLSADTAGNSGTESVPLQRLDDCMQAYGWKDIDFLKLDAEGEEDRILEGGGNFFRTCSPLVMFELKHGFKINNGLIQSFLDMGYETYKYIPGLLLLAPFDKQEEPDPYQLNLFCCKPDRAKKLQDIGLLAFDEPSSIDTSCDLELWEKYLQDFPYAPIMFATCGSSVSQPTLPGWPEYRGALNAYVLAQDTGRPPGERYHLLRAAFIQLVSVLDMHTNLQRLLSLTRIASELGNRAVAVNILNELVKHFEQHSHFKVEEPFLAISARAADIDPKGMLANWCLVQILSERERRHALSSYFTGASSLPTGYHRRTGLSGC